MITRRKIGTLVAAALGAVGVGAKAKAAPPENISQEELDTRFLASRRALLLPGLYRERERDALDRTLDLRVIGSEYLLLTSYNGYDRQERWVNIPVAALRKDWLAAYNKAVAQVLPLGDAQRKYIAFGIAKKASADVSAANRHLEFGTWLDNITDNVLCKAYDPRYQHAFAFSIPLRAQAQDNVALEAEIKIMWAELANVMNERPIRDEAYVKDVRGLITSIKNIKNLA